jgi:hypothetical protein
MNGEPFLYQRVSDTCKVPSTGRWMNAIIVKGIPSKAIFPLILRLIPDDLYWKHQNPRLISRPVFNKIVMKGKVDIGAPTETRTPVLALRGLRPGPLDDGGSAG